MKKVKAAKLKEGDLIFYKDSYFEVVNDERYDAIPLPNLSNPSVLVQCFMCPSNSRTTTMGVVIGSFRHIKIDEEVVLLC